MSNYHGSASSLLCTSFCSDLEYCLKKSVFQCSDNSFIFLDGFCDGIVDCIDGSDEIVDKLGFECNKCVLPQNNLYDDFAQCDDNSDLCLFANNTSCFQCLDKRLIINSRQVCDDVNNCYDSSDELLCDTNIDAEKGANLLDANNSLCLEKSTINYQSSSIKIYIFNQYFQKSHPQYITCKTKFGSVAATLCDGRPECKDFSDECECENLPSFCNDSCHFFFSMGDRYCDGVEDLAWVYLNKTLCPKGFDELHCPKRFKCNANESVSIDVLEVCDGKPDCDDRSDENNCTMKKNAAIFSSDTEMIAEPRIKAAFWIIGFIVLLGNGYVVADTAKFLGKQKVINFALFQRVIILNISIADFIMGVYLITIAVYSQAFSGIYGSVDFEWRSSIKCSIIGSLSVISSQASCFFMVVLTTFRLINVCNPITSRNSSLVPWKLCLVGTWVLSICISIIPMAGVAPSYFVHSISFSSRFHQTGLIEISRLKQFMCRYAFLSKTTLKDYGSELESIEKFLQSNLPDSLPVKMFGYYGETSVCMPRFYVAQGERSWEYTLSLITLNLLCFAFIVVSYVKIYLRSNKSSSNIRSNRSTQQATTMQKRIGRIIATDFCCWIPICIMAYIRLVVDFSNIVYQISAVCLLPINSALNPFLFTSLPEKLFGFCRSKLTGCCKSN